MNGSFIGYERLKIIPLPLWTINPVTKVHMDLIFSFLSLNRLKTQKFTLEQKLVFLAWEKFVVVDDITPIKTELEMISLV